VSPEPRVLGERGGRPTSEEQLMPKDIGLEEMRRLRDEGAQIVEVLPQREYAEEHLPGAVNIPLKSLNETTAALLDKGRPVIVYCWDYF
jgi:rhodanese-related sulfurtransferase